MKCSCNPSLRCIKIQSDKVEVDIQGSLFNNTFQALYLDSRICASLRIFRSRFIKISNEASDGPLFATSSRGFLKINITSVLFRTCKAKKYGCVIVIGKPKEGHGRRHNESIPDELYFTLRDVTIEQWAGIGECVYHQKTSDKWGIPRYTTRKRRMTILYHAIENTVDSTKNGNTRRHNFELL